MSLKMSLKFFSITLVSSLLLTACSHGAASKDSLSRGPATRQNQVSKAKARVKISEYNLSGDKLALDGYCPVAYFAVNKAVKGSPNYTSNYQGVRYQFVSADAKAAFDKEPEKFVPAYGGWCAYGLAINKKFPIDPHNFKIVNGRLLLFLKNKDTDAQVLWNKEDEREFLDKADDNWSALTQ